MANPMSSQEVVFWISLFGLDFGIPMMLPERVRFQIGAVATGLSITGLFWSLGYRFSVGWHTAIVFMTVGATSAFLAGWSKDKYFPLEVYETADHVEGYLARMRRGYSKAGEPPNIDPTELDKILTRYKRDYALLTWMVVNDSGGPCDRAFRTLVKNPQSLEDIETIVNRLNEMAQAAPKYRWRRVLSSILGGSFLGLLAFAGFHFIVRMFPR